jgi:hypothetical protein
MIGLERERSTASAVETLGRNREVSTRPQRKSARGEDAARKRAALERMAGNLEGEKLMEAAGVLSV